MSAGNITINEGTQTHILTDVAGTVETGVVKIDTSAAGTYGALWNGNVGIGSGTITTLPNIPGGSIVVTAGTINSATVSGNVGVTSGTINVSTISTLPNIPGGTINTATVSGNLGTISTINLATVTGNVGISSGTINVSTISTLPNLPQGSINVTAGTVTVTTGTIISSGTTTGVGTVTNIGSITNVGQLYNAGTVQNQLAGTITALQNGTVSAGTINIGTVVGKDANAAPQTGNPIAIGGTDSGGTIRTVKVDSSGNITTNTNVTFGTIVSGTINAGTFFLSGGTIDNATISKGSIAITAGTISAGTIAISDGTTKVNVMASGVSNGTGAQNAQLIAGGFAEFSGSATAGTTDLIASFDVSNYKWASLQIQGTFVGTINPQVSNDNSNFFSNNFLVVTSTSAFSANIAANGIYRFPIESHYLRIRMNAFTSGTANATLDLFTQGGVSQNQQTSVNQGGAWNVTGTIATGSIAVTAGTVSAGTINTGTVNTGTINVATVTAGTINVGTFVLNPIPTLGQSTFGTHGTTGVSIFGTLAGGTGSGAGTEIFLTSLSLSIPSTGGSQDVSIGWGTNAGTFQSGTGLIVRGNFPPGGGIQKEFMPPINSGTNAQLCVFQAGAGTVDVSVSYFITPSSL